MNSLFNISSIVEEFSNDDGSITSELNNMNIKIIKNYLKLLALLSTESLDKIKNYIDTNQHMTRYINKYYNNRIYPIHYLFTNKNICNNMIEYMISINAKLYYDNEDN